MFVWWFGIYLQVKYYGASEFEVDRYNQAILKYQVLFDPFLFNT